MTGNTKEFEYSAFISYRHLPTDRKWAKWLLSALETYRIPKSLQKQGFPARLGKIFRDEDEIPASSDLSSQIRDALEKSKFLIVICSKETSLSKWVSEEIQTFHKLGRSDQIIALLVDGEPHEAFPELLLKFPKTVSDSGQIEWSDKEREPIAADVRKRKDTSIRELKRSALLRIAASILGVNFDDLKRRDEKRKRQKLQFYVAALVTASVFTSGLAYYAFSQRQIAVQNEVAAIEATIQEAKQRKLAEESEKQAIKARAEAERQTEIALIQRNQALVNESKLLSRVSAAQIFAGDEEKAMLVALDALPDVSSNYVRPTIRDATQALYNSIWKIENKQANTTTPIQFSQSLITQGDNSLAWVDSSFNGIVVSHNRQYIITRSTDQTALLKNMETGGNLINLGAGWDVGTAKFSQDSNYLFVKIGSALQLFDMNHIKPIAKTLTVVQVDNSPKNFRPLSDDINTNKLLAYNQFFPIHFNIDPISGGAVAVPYQQPTVSFWSKSTLVNQKTNKIPSTKFFHAGKRGVNLEVAFLINKGLNIVATSVTGPTYFWSLDNVLPIAELPRGKITASPLRNYFILQTMEGGILYSSASGKRLFKVPYGATFSANDEFLYAATDTTRSVTGPDPFFIIDIKKFITSNKLQDPSSFFANGTNNKIGIAILPTIESKGIIHSTLNTTTKRAVASFEDGRIRIFDWENDKVINIITSDAEIETFAAFSSTGKTLIATTGYKLIAIRNFNGGYNNRIGSKTARIIDAVTGLELSRLIAERQLTRAALSSDGKLALTSDIKGDVILWDVATSSKLQTFTGTGSESLIVEFFKNDNGIFIINKEGKASIWFHQNIVREQNSQLVADKKLNSICTGNSKYILEIPKKSGSVIVKSKQTGEQISSFDNVHYGFVKQAELSPDARYAVTKDGAGVVRLWETETGKLVQTLNQFSRVGAPLTISFFEFTADCRYVLTSDQSLKLWNLETGVVAKELTAMETPILAIASNPKGRWTATMSKVDPDIDSYGFRVRVWDQLDEFHLNIPGRWNTPPKIYFNNDGALIVETNKDKREYFQLFIDDQAMVKFAKLKATRCLSTSERAILSMSELPNRWCITGVGMENADVQDWEGLYPFESDNWKRWQIGRDQGKSVILPNQN